jgi:hypothetical protein
LESIKIGVEISERLLGEFNTNPAMFENNPIGLEAMASYYQY